MIAIAIAIASGQPGRHVIDHLPAGTSPGAIVALVRGPGKAAPAASTN